MATFLQMKTRIAADMSRGDLAVTIGVAINRAIEFYEKENFSFNETSGTLSTVAGVESYVIGATGIPSDILDVESLTITRTSTDIYPLPRISYQTFREYSTIGLNGNRAIPDMWAIYGDSFYFYPVPNLAYTITVYYQKRHTALSADADTNVFMSEAEDLIESRARWWVWTRIRNYPAASAAKAEEVEALDALRSKTNNLLLTNRIRPCN